MPLGFAKAVDMEPGMRFRRGLGQDPHDWMGVDPVESRFTGKRRVKVICRDGYQFVCEWDTRLVLVEEM